MEQEENKESFGTQMIHRTVDYRDLRVDSSSDSMCSESIVSSLVVSKN